MFWLVHHCSLSLWKIRVQQRDYSKTFAKENEEFEVKALSVSGQLLSEQIDLLAKLPTLHQALGMLAGVTLAPVTKLVRTLNEVPTKVTRVVAAVRTQKRKLHKRLQVNI